MTKVTIKTNEVSPKVTHKVGNFYKTKNHGIYILCNVEGKAVLISAKTGWFFSTSKELREDEDMLNISDETFRHVCCYCEFVLVPSITICEE